MKRTPAVGRTTRTPRGSARNRGAGGTVFPPVGRDAGLLAALIIAAFLLRAAHILASRANPFFESLPVDCAAYDQWAQRIASGAWLGRGVFYQDPLYPYFLGVLYATLGRHLTLVLLVQALLGSLNVALLWGLGTLFWNRRVGWIASVLAALYAPFWFYDGLILKTFLEVLLLNGALLAFGLAARARDATRAVRLSVGAGLLIGLGILTRANYLLLPPIFLVWLWKWAPVPEEPDQTGSGNEDPGRPESGRSEPRRTSGRRSGRRRRSAVAFLIAVALMLLPVLVRNRIAGGEWVLTTSQGGQNFYIGNNPWNHRGTYAPLPFLRPDPQHEESDFHREAVKRIGHETGPSETSRFWFKEGLAHLAAHPAAALALDVKKLGLLLHRFEIPDNEDFAFWSRWSGWLRFNPVRFALVGPPALLGLWLGFRRRRGLSLLYLTVLAYLGSVALFFVFGRYRLPAASLLLIFAAGAVSEVHDRLRVRDRRGLGMAAVVLVGAMLVVHRSSSEERGPMTPGLLTNLGSAYLAQNRPKEALEAQRQAVRMAPEWDEAVYNLGITLYKTGNRDEAVSEFRRVLELNPNFAGAWSYLGNLLDEKGEESEAVTAQTRARALEPGSGAHPYNLARILAKAGRTAEAEQVLGDLFRMDDAPYSVDGRLILAGILAGRGDAAGAAQAARYYLERRPDSPLRAQIESSLRAWESGGN